MRCHPRIVRLPCQEGMETMLVQKLGRSLGVAMVAPAFESVMPFLAQTSTTAEELSSPL